MKRCFKSSFQSLDFWVIMKVDQTNLEEFGNAMRMLLAGGSGLGNDSHWKGCAECPPGKSSL